MGRRPTPSRTCSWCSSHPDGAREPLAIGVPGDREVDQKRLEAQVEPAEVEAFDEADFAAHPMLAKGYIGPGVLGEKNESGIRYLVDPRIVEGTRWVTGADVDGSHVIDLVAGRDFTPDGTIEAAEVRDGDPCPNGDGTLETARGIEMGHIFQLGRKFADALDLKVLDENGKLVTVTMGSYGIGASRAVAAIAEGTLDELGLAWPREVAPADVHLVAAGKDEHVFAAAERIAHELVQRRHRRALRRPARQDQPRREVQGRRADRRARPSSWSARASPPTAPSRSRTAPPAPASRSPPTTSSTTSCGSSVRERGIDAVIFDWGGTLTRWHDIDFHAESLALAQAVVNADHDVEVSRARLHQAGDTIWGRSRDHQQSATVADLFTEAGLEHDPDLLTAYYEFWEPHTLTDPEVGPLFEALRGRRDQGRRALQHDLAARLARGLLPPRRRPPPDRRRRLHQRDPVDEAVAARVPRGDGRGRRDRPGPLRLRRGPALRRRLGRAERRAAGDPRPAQRIPADPGRPHRGRAGRRRAPAGRDRRPSLDALGLTTRTSALCAMQKREVGAHSRAGPRPVACFCKSGHPPVPPHPGGCRSGPQVQASAVRVLVRPGEHLGSSPEGEFADRCFVQGLDRPAGAARRRCSPPARRTSSRTTAPSPARPAATRVGRVQAGRQSYAGSAATGSASRSVIGGSAGRGAPGAPRTPREIASYSAGVADCEVRPPRAP